MTCNKDSSGAYIPLVGSCEETGQVTLPTTTAPTSADLTELDKAIQFLDWLDKGNRSFNSKEERARFYDNFPGLRKYENIAETRSPASDVERDLRASRGDSAPSADQGEFSKPLGEALSRNENLQKEVGGLRNQLHDLNTEVGADDRDFAKAQTERQQIERMGSSTSTSLPSLQPMQPQIPAGWVPCECPADHPKAGIFVNGVQYHTPLLRCPKK